MARWATAVAACMCLCVAVDALDANVEDALSPVCANAIGGLGLTSTRGAFCERREDDNVTFFRLRRCKEGRFCPNITTELECPSDRFCPPAHSTVRSCSLPLSCLGIGPGAGKPNQSLSIAFWLGVYLFVALDLFLAVGCLDRWYRRRSRNLYCRAEFGTEMQQSVSGYARLWRIKTQLHAAEGQLLELTKHLLKNVKPTEQHADGMKYENAFLGQQVVDAMEMCPLAAWRGRANWLVQHRLVIPQTPVVHSEGLLLGPAFGHLPSHTEIEPLTYYTLHPTLARNDDEEVLRFMRREFQEYRMRRSEYRAQAEFLESGLVKKVTSCAGMTRLSPAERIPIMFDSVTVDYGNPERPALQSISGFFRPGCLTAILGPSGAGKTTFLNMLNGTLTSKANVSGSIFVGDTAVPSLAPFKGSIAFMPQEPVLHDYLTVAENIWITLLTVHHNPAAVDIQARTAELLSLMDLKEIPDTIIGGGSTISGGQKKRLSMALALATEPRLLLLDEPTSGLDTSSSVLIMKVVKQVAALGINVICTIHQPRREIYDMFDDVMVFVKRGRQVYDGPSKTLESYLSKAGYPRQDEDNPANFVFDVMSGLVQRRDVRTLPSEASEMDYLTDTWHRQQRSISRRYFAEFSAIDSRPRSRPARTLLSTLRQLGWAIVRNLIIEARTISKILIEGLALGFFCIILMITSISFDPFSGQPLQIGFAMSLLIAILGTVRSAGLLVGERCLYELMSRAGLSSAAYFLAFLAGRPLTALVPGVAIASALAVLGEPSAPGYLYGAVMFGILACRAYGAVIGVSIRGWLWQIAAISTALLMFFLKGIAPGKQEIEGSLPGIGGILYAIAPTQYISRAVFNADASRLEPGTFPQLEALSNDFPEEWSLDDSVADLVLPLLYISLGVNAFALLYLVISEDHFSKVYDARNAVGRLFVPRRADRTSSHLRFSNSEGPKLPVNRRRSSMAGFLPQWSQLVIDTAKIEPIAEEREEETTKADEKLAAAEEGLATLDDEQFGFLV